MFALVRMMLRLAIRLIFTPTTAPVLLEVVKEVVIRLVTGAIILLCVVSRAVAVPIYLRQLGLIAMNPGWDVYFNQASKLMLFVAGLSGAGLILFNVIRAYREKGRVRTTLIEAAAP